MNVAAIALAGLMLALPQAANATHVCVRHVEPLQYPPIARNARVEGRVSVHLKIGPDGRVKEVTTAILDQRYKVQDVFKRDTELALRKWTFACFDCAPDTDFELEMSFDYHLLDEEREYSATEMILDLPDRVSVTAYSPVCDHCERKKK